jgi:hypothetical protein
MMMGTCKRGAIILFALCAAAVPARAVFFPAVQRPTEEQLLEQETHPYWNTTTLGAKAMEAFGEVVGGLALSFDDRYSTQDLVGDVPALNHLPFNGKTKLNTFTFRPEIVWTNWLSTYAIAGQHRGSNGSGATTLDLDGWTAGAGVSVALGLPPHTPHNSRFTFDPLFVIPDFNWTRNEFDGVDNAVNVYNLTTRIGAALRTVDFSWGLYAGPQYQSSTKDLTIRINSMPLGVKAEPKEAWSGVIGSVFGVYLEKQKRADVQMIVEGGVGNRQGVQVSLRYEHDFLEYQLFKK